MKRNVLHKEIEAFTNRFVQETGLGISFTPEACDLLIDIAVDLDKTIRAVCEDRFKDLEHGLKIVSRNSGITNFEINKAMAENPDKELSKLVVESFQNKSDDVEPIEIDPETESSNE